MTENLTEQDKTDLRTLGVSPEGEAPQDRCLLEVWHELMKSVDLVREQPIPALVAHKVVSSWPKLSYQDTARYHEVYHDILGQIRDLLDEQLTEHPSSTSFVGDEDMETNRQIYIDLLIGWNLLMDDMESDWRAGHPESHIQIAAIVDARAFVFSSTGLVGHLTALNFQLDDEEFLQLLTEAKEDL